MSSLFDSSDSENEDPSPSARTAIGTAAGVTLEGGRSVLGAHFAAVHSRVAMFVGGNVERTLKDLGNGGEAPRKIQGQGGEDIDLWQRLGQTLELFQAILPAGEPASSKSVDLAAAQSLGKSGEELARQLWDVLVSKSRWPHNAWSETFIFCELMAACAWVALSQPRRAVRCADYAFVVGVPKEETNLIFRLVGPLGQRDAPAKGSPGKLWPPLLGPQDADNLFPLSACNSLEADGMAKSLAPGADLQPAGSRANPTIEELEMISKDQTRPLLLRGCASTWAALDKWRALEYFSGQYADRVVPVELGNTISGMEERAMPLGEFIDDFVGPSSDRLADYLKNGGQDSAKALFSQEFHKQRPGQKVGYLAQHNLFDQMPELRRDFAVPRFCSHKGNSLSKSSIWFGTSGTETLLHYDSYNNLLVQVAGVKFVALFPKSQTPKLYPSHTDKDELLSQGNTSRVNVAAPDLGIHPLYASAKGYFAVLRPGDTLFIPRGMWHYVKALTPSLSMNFWINFPLED